MLCCLISGSPRLCSASWRTTNGVTAYCRAFARQRSHKQNKKRYIAHETQIRISGVSTDEMSQEQSVFLTLVLDLYMELEPHDVKPRINFCFGLPPHQKQ
jgi:hypothetical protein